MEEIQKIEGDFIEAARRAYEAGYDGVELHGCHNYLLCQFFNRRVNRRTDLYNAEDMQIVKNIIDGIRKVTPPEFVVGIRLGAFEPEISDGVAHAKKLEAMGIDFINVSYGFDKEAVREKPQGYPFAEAIYGAESDQGRGVGSCFCCVRNPGRGDGRGRSQSDRGGYGQHRPRRFSEL